MKADDYVEKLMFEIDNTEMNIQCCYQLTRFSIKMKFLYYETSFFICGNKRTKDKKTSHVIECVMIFVFFILRKLRYVECQAI